MIKSCNLRRQSNSNFPSAIHREDLQRSEHLDLRGALPRRGSTEIAAERFFCGTCGSMLWGEDNRYPQRVYPAASCLDTNIPRTSHACIYPFQTLF